jgi:hypothetical protein
MNQTDVSQNLTFMNIMKGYKESNSLSKNRACIRKAYLAASLETGQTFEVIVEFSGNGDSGNYENSYDLPEVVYEFITENYGEKIPFDWYNSEGGFGTITWDMALDTITIEGSYYVAIAHDAGKVVF